MTKTIKRNGWDIIFHQIFDKQYLALENRTKKLKKKLQPQEYITHNKVKLFGQVRRGITKTIPENPFADYFALRKPLNKYGRLKKKGLNDRYRLFFKAYKEEKKIVILWLGYPRKEGDKKDCYEVFKKFVNKGEFPESLESLLVKCSIEENQ